MKMMMKMIMMMMIMMTGCCSFRRETCEVGTVAVGDRDQELDGKCDLE